MIIAKSAGVAVTATVYMLFATLRVGAIENSGVGGRPANPREDNPRTSSIFIHEIQPGEKVTDAVKVINSTDTPKKVIVYPTDALIASGGAFSCEQKEDELNDAGAWIAVEGMEVALEPYGTQNVPFTIQLPSNAGVGEHNACIAIQALEAPVATGSKGVTLSFRSAIRVAITVPGDIRKELSLTSLAAEVLGDKIIVRKTLKNSGNVSLDTNITVQLKPLLGGSLSEAGGQFVVLPAQEAEFNLELKRPKWGGLYRVVSTTGYNGDVNAGLGDSGSVTILNNASLVFVVPSLPLLGLYGVLLLLLAAGIGYVVRKRQHHKRITRLLFDHTVTSGEDINSIADYYAIDWKTIAKINRIAPPYTLKKGQVIQVYRKDGMVTKADSHESDTSLEQTEAKPKTAVVKAKPKKTKTVKKRTSKTAKKTGKRKKEA